MDFRTRSGMTRSMPALMLSAARTIVREKSDDPYCCSDPSSLWVESESSVAETCIDFLEVQSVRIITPPAASSTAKLAGTFSLSAPIIIEASPEWRAIE